MSESHKHIQAHPSPEDSRKMQVTYETANSRRVHHLPAAKPTNAEPAPHGAGSFHDPEHHHCLLDRVEAMMRDTNRGV